jgi:predicted  nucleic acid-binding Zn-ribbon protein
LALRVDKFFNITGSTVIDDYDRNIGILVSFISSVDGEIKAIEVKIADRGVERIPGERVKLVEGKLIVTPEWKHEALKVIDALERAYKRRKALESIVAQSDIPSEIVDSMRRSLSEEIKKLKLRAEEAKRMVKARISEIENEMLHVASAIANLQMLYFSGEISDKSYTSGMNHLKKLKESLAKEKHDAKHILDKLEKTFEAASGFEKEKERPRETRPAPVSRSEAQKPAIPSGGDSEEKIVVKIAED